MLHFPSNIWTNDFLRDLHDLLALCSQPSGIVHTAQCAHLSRAQHVWSICSPLCPSPPRFTIQHMVVTLSSVFLCLMNYESG